MRRHSLTGLLSGLLMAGVVFSSASAHEGPDPVVHWSFTSRTIVGDICRARLGPDLPLTNGASIASDPLGESLDLTAAPFRGAAARGAADALPAQDFTVAAWVLVDEAERHGGIVSVLPVGESGEAGWSLGYDSDVFTFTLATQGADDGDGHATVLRGKTPYAKGKWFHVAGVYDGRVMSLYVNGRLESSTDEQSGPVLYAETSEWVLGGRPDKPSHPLRGRLREASVYDMAAREAWVAHEFEHGQQLVALEREARADDLSMIVEPYLQFGQQTSMTVMWQTSAPGSSIVHYGETIDCGRRVEAPGLATIHEVTIDGLEPETQYFYRVETTDDAGASVGSRPSTFSTAVREGTPFAFAVISDTQSNPIVAHKVATLAWAQRPSFLLHPGDLVGTGTNDTHWTQQFFPAMSPLISRVPFYPVLGNHERNAANYYEYMSLPDPEFYYEFQYGDAHFFLVDTNRNVGPGSRQYEWLDAALKASTAKWKFACHHHPPYSSDENDYGDLWKTNKSTRGDLRARELSNLYDKHAVDVVWTGHIHSYERTWPVKEGRAVTDGPIYMITGGGGGGLETPGPYRPFFQNQVRRGHHYVMVHLNGPTLELRSYDLEDRLFDTVTLRKAE